MEIKYTKLAAARARTGFAVAFTARSSLWLGDDHLLCIDSTRISESYKRFYFRDIQGIIIQRTMRFQWLNGIAGFFLLIFAVLILVTIPKTPPSKWGSGDIAGAIFFGSIVVLSLVLLIINLFYGPTCKTLFRTAVQTEEIPALCRIRQMRKVLEKIRPPITLAQGGLLTAEVASAWMQNLATPAGSAAQTTGTEPPIRPPGAMR